MKLICGNSNSPLFEEISNTLNEKYVPVEIKKFSDGEIFVEIKDSLRGHDVFILQSTSFPVNDSLMELLTCIDAAKRASAKSIFAVVPYFGYARQDRKTAPRTSITAKLVANLLQVAGATHVITVDLHAGQIQGFFDIPVDNLYAQPSFLSHIKSSSDTSIEDIIITSPDIGGIARARACAKKLGSPIAIIDKRREKPGVSEVMNIIGDVNGKSCIIIDDIVDSGGTLCNAAEALLQKGAKEVKAYITHGVLSGTAIQKIENSALSKLFITNSIYHKNIASSKIQFISIAPLISEAISRIIKGGGLFELSE